ncbi:MAG TPA: DUF1684 domain-containing protein [Vicinamibacterales bacterium]|nr:DUF1684 domain-containing protein [Vicinamibacterales bacterium]
MTTDYTEHKRPGRSWWIERRTFSDLCHLCHLWLLIFSVVACSANPAQDYLTRIAAERARKDEMFRSTGGDSPVLAKDLDSFVPLAYFPIDESYAVPAQLEPAAQPVRLQMPTSTGRLRDTQLIGSLAFSIKGQSYKLAAFLEDGSRQLFVPFSDLTSGTETYQAGRYMNLNPTATGIYIVDFNIAYHPYCYYNAEYDCPLPPTQNRLTVPIRAGERLRKADATVTR